MSWTLKWGGRHDNILGQSTQGAKVNDIPKVLYNTVLEAQCGYKDAYKVY